MPFPGPARIEKAAWDRAPQRSVRRILGRVVPSASVIDAVSDSTRQERRPHSLTTTLGGVRCGNEGETEEERMARSDDRRGVAGISLGGIIVVVGIVLMFVWSFWIGLIIALVGLIAFGGFARGKWY